MSDNRGLTALAKGNAARKAVLAGRAERASSRSRYLTCPACNERAFHHRAKTDICEPCLTDLWNAQDVMQGAFDAGKATGLIPVALTTVPHFVEYPMLATTEQPPAQASFARWYGDDRDRKRDPEDARRTLARLFVELMKGLATVLPVDPQARGECERLIGGDWHGEEWAEADDVSKVRLPADVVKALRDLWGFVQWHSNVTHVAGIQQGRDLLQQLNLGEITADAFTDEVARQTANRWKEAERVVAGAERRR